MLKSPNEIIIHVCKTLELDVNKLCGINCRASQEPQYADGRHISTNLIRKVHQKKITYKLIALMLGRKLKDGTGDHASAIYSEWICNELLKNKDKAFCTKYEKSSAEIIK